MPSLFRFLMVVGLRGAGKTTSTVKLARHLQDVHKKRVVTASLDVYRPAAIEQLATRMTREGMEHFESPVLDSVRERAVLARDVALGIVSERMGPPSIKLSPVAKLSGDVYEPSAVAALEQGVMKVCVGLRPLLSEPIRVVGGERLGPFQRVVGG